MAVTGFGGVDYTNPTESDQWLAGIGGEANAMNAASGRRSGGGGGSAGGGAGNLLGTGNGGWIDKSYQRFYTNPQLDLENQQLASKNAHWQSAFNLLSGRLGANQNPYTIGGGSGAGPAIDASPIWNPQQIQQNVNSSNAKTDASAAGLAKRNAGSLTGRGFGGSSPLLAALNQSNANAALASKTDSERNFRQTAAQDNSTQLLNAQKAQEGQFASRQQEAIQRAQPYFQQTNALIAALSGLSN